MTMWIAIMWTALVLTGIAWVYVSNRVCQFVGIKKITKNNEFKKAIIGGGITLSLFCIIGSLINFMNAIICLIYFALFWLVCDGLFALIVKLRGKGFGVYYAGILAIVLSFAALSAGWYYDHNVWATNYVFQRKKAVIQPLLFPPGPVGDAVVQEGAAGICES